MQKQIGWEDRLTKYIEKKQNAPFRWGTNDCVKFAFGCVKAITGIDALKESWSREWKSKAEAYQILKDCKADQWSDIYSPYLSGKYGLDVINPKMAQRGDLAMVETPYGLALGIVTINGIAVPGRKGLEYSNRKDAIKVWRIP